MSVSYLFYTLNFKGSYNYGGILNQVPLNGSTYGSDIFQTVEWIVTAYGGLQKRFCVMTYETKAMTGTVTRFAGQNGNDCSSESSQNAICGKSLLYMNAWK